MSRGRKGWRKYPPDSSELSASSHEGDLSGLESEGREANDSANSVAAVRPPPSNAELKIWSPS